MLLLDSNIVIYSLSPSHQKVRDFLNGKSLNCSIISKIEVLGYSRLTPQEYEGFCIFFDQVPVLMLSEDIVEIAIKLRRIKKMTLGDSIIAATAVVNNLELMTAKTKDFEWITELKLANFQL